MATQPINTKPTKYDLGAMWESITDLLKII